MVAVTTYFNTEEQRNQLKILAGIQGQTVSRFVRSLIERELEANRPLLEKINGFAEARVSEPVSEEVILRKSKGILSSVS
jgi:hypothetical protein